MSNEIKKEEYENNGWESNRAIPSPPKRGIVEDQDPSYYESHDCLSYFSRYENRAWEAFNYCDENGYFQDDEIEDKPRYRGPRQR